MLLLPAPSSVGPDPNPVKTKPPRMRRLSGADRKAIRKLYFRPRTLTADEALRIVERIGSARTMSALDRITQPSR